MLLRNKSVVPLGVIGLTKEELNALLYAVIKVGSTFIANGNAFVVAKPKTTPVGEFAIGDKSFMAESKK